MLLLKPDPTSGKQKRGVESGWDGRCSSWLRGSLSLSFARGLRWPVWFRRALSLQQLGGTLVKAIKTSKETVGRAEEREMWCPPPTPAQVRAQPSSEELVSLLPQPQQTAHFDIRVVAAFGSKGHSCAHRSCPGVLHQGVAGSWSPDASIL